MYSIGGISVLESMFDVSILYRRRKMFMSKMLESHGALGIFHLTVAALSLHNGASQEQLASVLKCDKATITNAVKKLESEGFVRRRSSDEDRRANKVFLTPKAIALVPKIEAAHRKWLIKISAGFSSDDLDRFLYTFHQAASSASK